LFFICKQILISFPQFDGDETILTQTPKIQTPKIQTSKQKISSPFPYSELSDCVEMEVPRGSKSPVIALKYCWV
jgi:peptide methionine sulfoxide reductase MsrA